MGICASCLRCGRTLRRWRLDPLCIGCAALIDTHLAWRLWRYSPGWDSGRSLDWVLGRPWLSVMEAWPDDEPET